MVEALVRTSTLAVKKEVTYGADPTLAAADVIELGGDPTFNSDFEPIDRTVVRNTKSKRASIRGAETTTSEIPIEAVGSGTAGTAPDDDVLYECALGAKSTSTAGTTTTGSTTTVIELGGGDGSNFNVFDIILMDPAGGTAYEIALITDISTDTLTVTPAFSAAVGTGVDVGAGVHYKPAVAELPSFFGSFWRGDITREDYAGNLIGVLALDFTTGQIVMPKFSIEGKSMGTPVSEAYGLGATSFDTELPLVARNMTFDIGGSSYAASNLALSLNNDLFRRLGITSSGTQKVIQTVRTVTGSFSLLYEDKTIEDAFRNDTIAGATIIAGDTPGNIMGTVLRQMKYLRVPKGVESGIFKYDVEFEAVMSVGEDEMVVSWL